MCGIAGWIDWQADLTRQRQTLEQMGQTLACRGPDAEGYWQSAHAGFAHRRLVVIDPAGGAQPMSKDRADNRWVMVYNGELYNTEDLRRELLSRGHRFRSHSDTEVLLTSFIEWGPSCVERLNGIFAFAIWDEKEESLFLARDRMGVKPLFYAPLDSKEAKGLLFASEIKALLAHPAVEPVLDAEGLAEVFALGPNRTPGHGVFQGIRELRPGHLMVADRSGTRIRPYWKLQSQPHEDDLATTAQKVRELLQDSVTRQLVSDVPVGAFLSGGLDSSALAALATLHYQEEGLGPLTTFSVDYLENDRYFRPNDFQPNPDAPYVEVMKEFLGSRHHQVWLDTPELVESLTWAMRARDLPGMADVDSSLLLFCREIKQWVTVAISGECADEVFGGYPWFRRPDAINADTFPWSLKTQIRSDVLSPEVRLSIQPDQYIAQRYTEALSEVPRLPGEEANEARMREILYLTLTRWMPVLLDRKDRMSMAVGLEVRVPFCDHRLVEYVWNIPWKLKYDGQMVKGILRRSLEGVLPHDVLYRKKSPYPKTFNPTYTEAVRNGVLRILDDPSSPLLPLIDTRFIREIATGDLENFDIPWFGQLMRGPQLMAYLAQVDTWLREYKVQIRL